MRVSRLSAEHRFSKQLCFGSRAFYHSHQACDARLLPGNTPATLCGHLLQALAQKRSMATNQLDGVREGADAAKPKISQAGTDGGWTHVTPLKARYASPTGIMSFDGESAWTQYDPHMLVPKEWGKQAENWCNSLRDWPDPAGGMWATGNKASWKSVNYRRWPLHRVPKCVSPPSAVS